MPEIGKKYRHKSKNYLSFDSVLVTSIINGLVNDKPHVLFIRPRGLSPIYQETVEYFLNNFEELPSETKEEPKLQSAAKEKLHELRSLIKIVSNEVILHGFDKIYYGIERMKYLINSLDENSYCTECDSELGPTVCKSDFKLGIFCSAKCANTKHNDFKLYEGPSLETKVSIDPQGNIRLYPDRKIKKSEQETYCCSNHCGQIFWADEFKKHQLSIVQNTPHKSIWKSVEELPDYSCDVYVKWKDGEIVRSKYLTAARKFRMPHIDLDIDDSRFECYCELTDFINHINSLEERIKKLEGK